MTEKKNDQQGADAVGSGLSGGLDDGSCPRCRKFVNGPKTDDGCLWCGHLNGRTPEARYRIALEAIKDRSGFWAIQSDEDRDAFFDQCHRICREALSGKPLV